MIENSNSPDNQKIKGQFVAREVLTCFSYEMDAVLKASARYSSTDLPSYDEIENIYEYLCPECGEGYQEEDEACFCCVKVPETCPYCKSALPEKLEFLRNNDRECVKCNMVLIDRDKIQEPENEPQEIFEWWIVTDYLYRKLRDKGHPVLEWGNNHYWGRCTTGQAILLDGAISEICSEMEILTGQKYSWEKK